MQASSSLEFIVSLIDNTKEQFANIAKNIDVMNKQTQSSREVLQDVALKSGIAFGALSLSIGKAVSDFATFDASIQKAGANVGATQEQLQQFRDVVMKVGADTGVGADAAANALFYLAGGSVDANEAMTALQDTVTFAKANQLDLVQATLMSSQVMSLFKIEADDVGHALDIVTRAGQISFATATQLSDSFQQAAPMASQLGVSMTDLTAIIGALGDVGYLGSEAGVALKRSFTSLLTVTPQSADALAKLGLSVQDVQNRLQNPIELFKLLQSRLEGIQSPIQRAAILSEIFGQGAGPAMAALLAHGTDAIEDYKTKLEEAGNATSEAAKRQKEAENPLQNISEAMHNMSITIGQALTPALNTLASMLIPVINGVISFISHHKTLVSTIALVVTGVTGLIFVLATLGAGILAIPGTVYLVVTAMSTLASGVSYLSGTVLMGLVRLLLGGVVSAFTAATTAIGATTVGVGALNLVLSVGFLGIIAGVIGLLVAVGVQFYKLSEEVGGVRNAWTLAWLSMEETFWNFVAKVISGVDWILEKIPGLGKVMDGILDSVRSKAKAAGDSANVFALSLYNQADAAKKSSDVTAAAAKKSADAMGLIPPVSSETSKAVKKHWEDMAKALANTRDEILKTYSDMKKAQDDYLSNVGKEQEDYNSDVVNLVAQSQKDIEDLKIKENQARAKGNYDELIDLGKQIQEKQSILISYNQMQLGLDTQVEERKKYLHLNELQRLEYDHQEKLKKMQVEFLQEQVKSLQKVVMLTEESNKIIGLVGQQKAAKLSADAEMQRSADARIKNEAEGIKGFLQESITQYQSYANSVNSILNTIKYTGGGYVNPNMSMMIPVSGKRASGGPVSMGQSYLVGENGPELFTPTQYGAISASAGNSGGLTIVVTGNSFVGREGIADQISRDIMAALKSNVKL